jgi:hypothetical protein
MGVVCIINSAVCRHSRYLHPIISPLYIRITRQLFAFRTPIESDRFHVYAVRQGLHIQYTYEDMLSSKLKFQYG